LDRDKIWKLTRGGHDPSKSITAYKAATEHKGQPTLILPKTVKGYGMGEAGEGLDDHPSAKKMGEQALREFRDRFDIKSRTSSSPKSRSSASRTGHLG
jgi:pyruvate dehydrogenase E1 component